MTTKAGFALIALAALVVSIGGFERGNRLYRAGRYAEAVEAYRKALEDGEDTPQLHYNLGTALLRIGRFGDAQSEFRAALRDVDPELRERTLYNFGNAWMAQSESADPENQRRLLDSAVVAYKAALRLQPEDRDAKWNLELALDKRDQAPPAGGGGDQQDQDQDQQQQQDDGGGDQQQPGGQPRPQQRQQGGQDPMSQQQAEQILNAVEQDEKRLYEEQLRKGSRESPVLRDW